MAKLNEGDRAVVTYGNQKGVHGIVKHIGNLFGDGDVVSLCTGDHWMEIPLKQVRKSN